MRSSSTRVFMIGLATVAAFASTTVRDAVGAIAVRTYVGGRVSLELEGVNIGSVDKASGGQAVGSVAFDKQAGAFSKKHIAGIKYEDIQFDLGAGASKEFFTWLSASMNGTRPAKSGALLESDVDGTLRNKLAFSNATIADVTFPALDATSGKNAAFLTVTLSPEKTTRSAAGGKADSKIGAKTKAWIQSNFRVTIPGLEDATRSISKVDALSVRFKTVSNAVGVTREYQRTPVSADISNLIITVPESRAASLYKWQEEFLGQGKSGDANEKTATIELLDASLKGVLFTVSLKGVGVVSVASAPVEAGQESVRNVQAELYVESAAFEPGAL